MHQPVLDQQVQQQYLVPQMPSSQQGVMLQPGQTSPYFQPQQSSQIPFMNMNMPGQQDVYAQQQQMPFAPYILPQHQLPYGHGQPSHGHSMIDPTGQQTYMPQMNAQMAMQMPHMMTQQMQMQQMQQMQMQQVQMQQMPVQMQMPSHAQMEQLPIQMQQQQQQLDQMQMDMQNMAIQAKTMDPIDEASVSEASGGGVPETPAPQ